MSRFKIFFGIWERSRLGEEKPPPKKKEGKGFILLAEQHRVPMEWGGLCEMGFGAWGAPSRIGGGARPTGTPVNLEL